MAAAFASLPQPGQSILILQCVLELTDGEIGAVVGMSRSAVQRHRTKTLETIYSVLADVKSDIIFRNLANYFNFTVSICVIAEPWS